MEIPFLKLEKVELPAYFRMSENEMIKIESEKFSKIAIFIEGKEDNPDAGQLQVIPTANLLQDKDFLVSKEKSLAEEFDNLLDKIIKTYK